jgi:hypothetical protein
MRYVRKNYKHQWQSAGLTSEHAHHVCVVYQFLAPVVLTNWENATLTVSTEHRLGGPILTFTLQVCSRIKPAEYERHCIGDVIS